MVGEAEVAYERTDKGVVSVGSPWADERAYLRLAVERGTQAQLAILGALAGRSGVGIATIIRVDRDRVEPLGSTIRTLAAALEVEPEELVRRTEDARYQRPRPEG